jgi:hypothetical protein
MRPTRRSRKSMAKPRVVNNYVWLMPDGKPAEQVKQIADRQKQLQEALFKKYKAAKSEAEQEKLFETEYPEPLAPGRSMSATTATGRKTTRSSRRR